VETRLVESRMTVPVNLHRTAGAISLRISYGYKVQENDDPFVALADEATEQFSFSAAPGLLVNLIPARE
jgi:hypothetical protein